MRLSRKGKVRERNVSVVIVVTPLNFAGTKGLPFLNGTIRSALTRRRALIDENFLGQK